MAIEPITFFKRVPVSPLLHRQAVKPHQVKLLILQPTPFCNLDCSYCYLPDRADKRRMSLDTVSAVGREVLAPGLTSEELTVIWHAGEPLVVPIAWYQQAFSILAAHGPSRVKLTHAFQTNGTLIDEAWVAFFRQHQARVGISIDGPKALHDERRRGRSGQGSFEHGMRGLRRVRDAGLPFHVISVLSARSLRMPDELFDFYASEGIRHICFNVEEIEGLHVASSMAGKARESDFAAFLRRFIQRCAAMADPPWVRELAGAVNSLIAPVALQGSNTQVQPLAMLSVGVDGALSTFSPELPGAHAPDYANFSFGNIHTGGIRGMLEAESLRAANADIASGVAACERECRWFQWCGGGAPANKWFETGDLKSTETLYCRLTRKVLLETVLDELEAGHLRS